MSGKADNDKSFSNIRYIETLENKLNSDNLSNDEVSTLYSNIAAAQLELGLFRKCIKSCQCALDRSPSHTRSVILKGKALIASGKKTEALDGWQQFLDGDTVFCDIVLLQELRDLVSIQTNEVSGETITAGSSSSPNTAVNAPPPVPAKGTNATVRKVVPVNITDDEDASTTPISSLIKKRDDRSSSESPTVGESTFANKSADRDTKPSPSSSTAAPKPIKSPSNTTAATAAGSKVASAADEHQATLRKALTDFHSKNIGTTSPHQTKPLFLKAMKSNLPHLCGEDMVDDLVGLGYINVNAGNHNLALTIFKLLLDYRKDLPSALIGLGSIHAMQRQLDLAITELTSAIDIDPSIADAWKRRGQTKAAKGLVRSALKDLSKALSLLADADIFNQRGLVYNQAKNYAKALADFKQAQTRGLSTAALLNYIGMCDGQLGNATASIESHKAAVAMDPKLREAYLNMALMYKEVGQWRDADKQFTAAINADLSRHFSQAHNYRAVMYYQLGRPASALKITVSSLTTLNRVVSEAKDTTPAQTEDLLQNYIRAAVFCQAMGHFKKSIYFYDQALCVDSSNNCYFQRELALFYWHHLDVDLKTYSVDDKVDSRMKDGWCKHVNYREYMTRALAQQYQGVGSTHQYSRMMPPMRVPDVKIHIEDDSVGVDNSPRVNHTITLINNYALKAKLVELTKPFAGWIQLQTPGFLPNMRQHRMFGVAVVQMARALRKHMTLIQLEGVGLEIPDTMSSKYRSEENSNGGSNTNNGSNASSAANGSSSSASSSSSSATPTSGKRGMCSLNHTLGWRDFFDMVVRWRQVSEPNDPVFWIDRFPIKAFNEGFGLQTPIVNGQMKTVRYYPYFPRAFAILKEAMKDGYFTAQDRYENIDQAKMARFTAATTLEEVYEVIQKDFYIIVPCPSLKMQGLVLEGTRLTLVAREPDGFEFTIRTPGRPYRWSLYESELDTSFHKLEDAFMASPLSATAAAASSATAGGPSAPGDDSAEGSEKDTSSTTSSDLDRKILRQALELFYLWVTLAPLSRGTAACGYAGLLAVVLAHGKTFAKPMPANKQLDWEAIFATDCEEFIKLSIDWFPLKDVDVVSLISESNASYECINTVRDMLDLMALPYHDEE